MKEELEKIGLKLAKWAKKYNKNYVSMCFLNDVIMANLETTDKDYEKVNIFINEEEVKNIK